MDRLLVICLWRSLSFYLDHPSNHSPIIHLSSGCPKGDSIRLWRTGERKRNPKRRCKRSLWRRGKSICWGRVRIFITIINYKTAESITLWPCLVMESLALEIGDWGTESHLKSKSQTHLNPFLSRIYEPLWQYGDQAELETGLQGCNYTRWLR